MQRENPWIGIGPASPSRIKAKRVSEALQHDFFWACNSEGRYTFLLQLNADAGDWGPAPELRGMTIGYYRGERQFQVVLNDPIDWEMFHVLCQDLMQATDQSATPRALMDALMARLVRWQRLLSRGPRRILDDQSIRGLIGELLFIRDELFPRFRALAIDFWQGPDRLPQDFVVGGYLFEVKTHLVGDAPKAYIASPSQLWSDGAPLYLVVIPLAHCGRHASGAVTLPELIDQLAKDLVGKPQLEAFEARLADFGYVPYPEYFDATYCPGPSSSFEVRDGFPRIIAGAIPDGVVDVRYAIRLDVCQPFRAQPDWKQIQGRVQ